MTDPNLFSNADLFDDYQEQWRPDKPSCFDCRNIERPFPNWKELSRCLLLKRPVERALGFCSQFKPHGGEHVRT